MLGATVLWTFSISYTVNTFDTLVRGSTEARSDAITSLWNYIDRIRPEPAIIGCDKLFLSPSGKPITANTIKLAFSRLARKSGVKRLHCHLCRHTFAINYLLNGGDIFSLGEILGHTTLEMVNHYLHFTRSQLTAQHHKYSPMDRLQKEQTVSKGKRTNLFERK